MKPKQVWKTVSRWNIYLMIFFGAAAAMAKNIEMPNTAETCSKVNGFGSNDRFSIAKHFKTSMSSVIFMGAGWGFSQYGSRTCVLTFDTASGPVRCAPVRVLSDDAGKTAFVIVTKDFSEEPFCWK